MMVLLPMLKRLLISVCLLMVALPLRAQQIVPSLTGTDFWVAFMYNTGSADSNYYYLIVVSEYECSAHISNTQRGWDTVVTLSDGIARVRITANEYSIPFGYSMSDDSWHISTSALSVVYASNYRRASQDITAVLPTPLLRCNYMTQTFVGQSSGQEVYVVAPYDSTMLCVVMNDYVTSDQGNAIYRPGDTLNVFMMRGQVCRLYCGLPSSNSSAGFSGTLFHSTKPVAVFQGHRCSAVPNTRTSCDHLYEQCIPLDFWGRHFIVMPTQGRVAGGVFACQCIGDMVMVTARDNNCTVSIEGQPVKTLSAGETYEFLLANHAPSVWPLPCCDSSDFYQSDALPVETSTPAQVCFYISGMQYGGMPGDPSLAVVPPVKQGISRIVTAVYTTPHVSNHYINIVTATEYVPLMTLDGQSIASTFTPTVGGYSYAYLTVDEGKHFIDADTGRFLAMFYGLGGSESYAYNAGMALRSAEYDVRADRHVLCLGDTVTIFVAKDDSLGVDWHVDGRLIATGIDTMHLSFDSVGLHRVAVVITPVGDTVWELISVNPVYSYQIADSICSGDTLFWNGMVLADSGSYEAPFSSVAGCDSVFTMHLSVLHQPQARMELSSERIDEEHPSFTASDCSLDAAGRHWWIDGIPMGDSSVLQYTLGLIADSIQVTLVAYNGICTDTLRRVVLIDHFGLWVPNVFTPDKSENNLFAPVANDAIIEELVIYNRWGGLVTRIAGPHPVWDGTKNGAPCPVSAYVWLVRYRVDSDPSRLWEACGTVTLFR